jgi:hypothetical protein
MLLGHEIETALRKWERYLHSIHVTDEFVASDRCVFVCECECVGVEEPCGNGGAPLTCSLVLLVSLVSLVSCTTCFCSLLVAVVWPFHFPCVWVRSTTANLGPKVLRFKFFLPTPQSMADLRSLMMVTFQLTSLVSQLRLSERVGLQFVCVSRPLHHIPVVAALCTRALSALPTHIFTQMHTLGMRCHRPSLSVTSPRCRA